MPATAAISSDLRSRLSLSPNHRIVLAPGLSTRDARHEDAAWVGSILRLIDDRFRILIWGRGDRVDRVVQRATALNQPGTLCVAERVLGARIDEADLMTVADATLYLGADVQTADSIALCRASGVPIVAVAGPPVFDRFRSEPGFVLLPEFSPPAVAEQVLRLFDGKS